MKKLLLFCIVVSTSVTAQDNLGFINSNYSGITGAQINPANIVDGRMKFDATLFGVSFNGVNNYIGMKYEALEHEGSWGDVIRKSMKGIEPFPAFKDSLFQKHYLVAVNNGKDKSIYLSSRITLPSFMVSLGTKNAVGLSIAARWYANLDGVSEPLAKLVYYDMGRNQNYDVTSLLATNHESKNMTVNTMAWLEYGITYAHVFKNDNEHFFKAGITPKLLQGIGSAYMNIKNFRFRFDNNFNSPKIDSLQLLAVINTEVSYAHSDNFEIASGKGNDKYRNPEVNTPTLNEMLSSPKLYYPGWGLDIGAVYEWRPKYMNYKFDMDGETGLWRKDKNKYKLKVGLSVLDIGSIKYKKAPFS